jgi:hypothetical protein
MSKSSGDPAVAVAVLPVQGRLARDLNHLYRQDPGRLVGISATGDDQDECDPEQT